MCESDIKFAVGTYTVLGGEGVLIYSLNPRTLQAECLGRQRVENPSFLCTSPSGGHVYAVNESGSQSGVHHLAVDENGALTACQTVASGADPCHILWLSPRTLCISNYSGGSVDLFDIAADGSLSASAQTLTFHVCGTSPRQQSSHIHFCATTPDGEYLVADDLGGDCIHILKIEHHSDGTARLLRHGKTAVHPEAGPRHICFGADGRFAYLITELSDEVMVFGYNGGALSLIQTLTAAPTPAHASGHIMVHPNGKWLYASVRRTGDGIAVYHIGDDGRLTQVGYTHTALHPRHFNITPDGSLLLCACRDSDTIEVYRINPADGTLLDTLHHISVAKAVCIQFID